LASCGLHERAVTSGPMDPTPAGLIMKKGVVIALLGILCVAPQAVSQQKTVTGKVTSEQGAPLSGVSVVIKGTNTRTSSNNEGNYSIRAAAGQVLQFRFIGTGLDRKSTRLNSSHLVISYAVFCLKKKKKKKYALSSIIFYPLSTTYVLCP